MRKITETLLSLVLSIFAVGCRPAIPDVGCVTRVNLPAIAPAGAMDCGDFEIYVRGGGPIINADSAQAIQCANNAVLAQTSFVLRERGNVPRTEECPPDSMCALGVGVVRAFVGSPINGVYAIALFSDGIEPIVQYPDGGLVPNLPDGGYFAQRLHMRKRVCQPAPRAVLAPLPIVALLSIDCVVAGGAPATLESQESQNACMGQ